MPGLTTQVDIIHHGTYVYRAFGRDRLPYVAEHWVNDYTFTNVANGRYVTIDEDYWANDIYVRDNGDGTNAGLSAERVYSEMLDAEGRKLEYESIWTLARWTKDNGGTPQDPRDDEWIDWAVVREGGHVADYCSATVAAVSDPGTASRLRGHPSWRTLAPGIDAPAGRRLAGAHADQSRSRRGGDTHDPARAGARSPLPRGTAVSQAATSPRTPARATSCPATAATRRTSRSTGASTTWAACAARCTEVT